MKQLFKNSLLILLILCLGSYYDLKAQDGTSIFTERPSDKEAIYFTPEQFPIKADGSVDVSDVLQSAINKLKHEKNFGVIFIPEGKYKISKTIYVPKAIRLIGYGKKRPEIFLEKNSPGYQAAVADDKGQANYMLWFVDAMVEEGAPIRDAGAGTFYSALSNINLRIEDGNPHAVALRTHFAQHSFISYSDIHIGKGKAGLFDAGNEIENVRFYGGDYGIYTTKASPGWQIMIVDTYFEGQRLSAIKTQEAGLTIVNLKAKNVPTVIDINENYSERLFIENSQFESISKAAIIVSNEGNAHNQITLRNIDCKDVPVLVNYRRSGKQHAIKDKIYKIKNFSYGLQIENLSANPEYKEVSDIVPLQAFPKGIMKDIPNLPASSTWVNIKDLGAVGDGVTDDTKAIQAAIEQYSTIYFPQGWYVISETLKMKPNTSLIGLHPYGTQFILNESTPSFSGFGGPKAILESSEGGTNILNGIGLNTGGYNYRAVGAKWMAGSASYMNDVKFVGGHGNMPRGIVQPRPANTPPRQISSPYNPVALPGMDAAWDNQYWSLWITNNGGGTFKDIWTASTYSTSGLYVNNTATPGRIYAMSLEHHVRNEARFSNVSNWKVYAFQLEEESREGADNQPIELVDCKDMTFANLYMFRVIRMVTPYPYSVRSWNSENIEFLNVHNYSQIKYTTNLPVYDINTDIQVRPWEFAKLLITGKEERKEPLTHSLNKVERLATGFEFAEGITRDSKGNIYFSENRMRRIYKWSANDNKLSLIADFPWKPLSLAFDSKDNLLVIFRYDPQPGHLVDGKQEAIPVLPDAAGTSFSGWGNSGFGTWVYSMDPNNPEETIKLLPRVLTSQINNIHKLILPTHRMRDSHDFNKVSVSTPEYSFIAPDGITYIPEYYDLARSAAVMDVFPGKTYFSSDEYDKRTVQIDMSEDGKPSNLKYFVEKGEFGSAVDSEGNLYIADGQIYVYDKEGKEIGMIEVPDRPSTIQFGGEDGNTLFITTRSSLYSVRIK